MSALVIVLTLMVASPVNAQTPGAMLDRAIADYAGRFDDCRRQFESHRLVNPADVENAAWHFLCVAKAESPATARARMLPVGPDSRIPMREIDLMFGGRKDPAHVLAAARGNDSAEFYGHLYVGLYLEATGNSAQGRAEIRLAASAQFARVGGYMHDVARVHLALHNRQDVGGPHAADERTRALGWRRYSGRPDNLQDAHRMRHGQAQCELEAQVDRSHHCRRQ